MRRPLAVALASAAFAAAIAIAVGRAPKPGASNARPEGPQGSPAAAGGPAQNDGAKAGAPSPTDSEGPGADESGASPSEPAADAPSPWLGPGDAGAPRLPGATAAPGPRASLTPAPKPDAPPPLTDPLRLDGPKVAGPTLKPLGPRPSRDAGAGETRPTPSPAVALYNDAERALVAGRGRECLSTLDRADAMPQGGADLREREQRAASPVVRAQCLMLLGGCDDGAARLRAAGWPEAAVEGARAKFCDKGAPD